jgi:hypothetical protein
MTKTFFIPYAGSTEDEGPGIEVVAHDFGVSIRETRGHNPGASVEHGQVARLAEVLAEIAAARREGIDQAHADEHAAGIL